MGHNHQDLAGSGLPIPSDNIFIDRDTKRLIDLLRYSRTTKLWIAAIQLDNCLYDFR